ncbi:hypothetical protein Tco_1470002, partial [Tanacetum coccineum]
FRGTRRGTPFAAQTAAGNAIRTVVEQGLEKGLTAVEGIEAVLAFGARSHVQESDSDSAFTLIKEGGHQTKGEVFACFSVRDASLFVITALKMFSRIREDGALSSSLWLFACDKDRVNDFAQGSRHKGSYSFCIGLRDPLLKRVDASYLALSEIIGMELERENRPNRLLGKKLLGNRSRLDEMSVPLN